MADDGRWQFGLVSCASPGPACAAEHDRVQEPQSRDRAVDRARAGAALVLLDLEVAQVFGRGGIGWPPQIGGKAPDMPDILILGAREQAPHHHIVQHTLAQRADGEQWSSSR